MPRRSWVRFGIFGTLALLVSLPARSSQNSDLAIARVDNWQKLTLAEYDVPIIVEATLLFTFEDLSILHIETKANREFPSANLKKLVLSQSGKKPETYLSQIEFTVNGNPFQKTELQGWGWPSYSAELPFLPGDIKITANIHGSRQLIGEMPLGKRSVAQSLMKTPGKISKVGPVPPFDTRASEIKAWLVGCGSGLVVHLQCAPIPEDQLIKASQVRVKMPFDLVPDGDRPLFATSFLRPPSVSREYITTATSGGLGNFVPKNSDVVLEGECIMTDGRTQKIVTIVQPTNCQK